MKGLILGLGVGSVISLAIVMGFDIEHKGLVFIIGSLCSASSVFIFKVLLKW